MVDIAIVDAVRDYLAALPAWGIQSRRAALFGSFARGNADDDSDIDLVVIASVFDGNQDRKLVENLWLAKADADERIEPIPCGEREWESDTGRPIIEIARSEGVSIVS
jgi:predicted nucleotidyltransferase